MSCNHCAIKFNFFHKEMGCANCGLSFCSKCLKQRSKISSKGTCDYNVCKLCHTKLNLDPAGSANQTYIHPPERFLKRLEDQSSSSDNKDRKLQAVQTDLSVDQKILARLEKLKDEGKGPPPSDSEIRARLARLKGENEYVVGPSRPVFTHDTRTDQQKADSLLQQFMKERDIELCYNPQEDIEVRLATLREQGVRPNEGPYISNLHDSSGSDEDVDKITKKIMDEVAMDEKCPIKLKSSPSDRTSVDEEVSRTTPELPWCVLCNNDAVYRCIDCSSDLYCRDCSNEVHKTWGDTDHKIVPFKPH